MLAQFGEQFVGNLHRRPGHDHSIIKYQFFKRGKRVAVPVGRQLLQLLFTDTRRSAAGRADVNSKWTADEGSHLNLR